MFKEFLAKFFKRIEQSESTPKAADVAEALRRLSGNDDFKLFRALIRSYYMTAARGVTICPKEAVDVLRGQMGAYERIFTITGEDGAEKLLAEDEQQKQFEQFFAEVNAGGSSAIQ
jgi:hypothetical protein